MFTNYITTALRVLRRSWLITLVTVFGLTVGITATLFIAEYINFERSANSFHHQLSSIYRLLSKGKTESSTSTAPGVAVLAKRDFSEVADYCRIAEGISNGILSILGEKAEMSFKSFRETQVAMVDPGFFNFFTFKILEGNAKALEQPFTAALSASKAYALFGTKNVIGKTFKLNNQFGRQTYTINGVYEDMPANSDLKYSVLLSLKTLENPANLNGNLWASLTGFDNGMITSYLKLNKNIDPKTFSERLNLHVKHYTKSTTDSLSLQAMAEIHLGSSLNDRNPTYGNRKGVYLLGGISLLILVIAWFNFVNLSTADNLRRAKEIGVRKLIGARKKQIRNQFIAQSFIVIVTSLIISGFMITILQPQFNRLISLQLSPSVLIAGGFWIYLTGVFISGSVLACFYASFSLASFKPVESLKGRISDVTKINCFNNTLIILQFALAVILITATLVLGQQRKYMDHYDLGMDLEHLVVIKGPESSNSAVSLQVANSSFENKLRQAPFITGFCSSGSVPGNYYNFTTSGIARSNASSTDQKKTYSIAFIDDRYFNTYAIGLVAGKNFNRRLCDLGYEKAGQVIVNETAAQTLGFRNPPDALGKSIIWDKAFEIVAVIKDYHHQSLKTAIDPVIFLPRTFNGYYTIKMNFHDLAIKIASIEKLYKQSFPGNPFEVSFEKEAFSSKYQSENQYSSIFEIASALTILIAGLGLLGLAVYSSNKRIREMGVRKVLGAGSWHIVKALNQRFMVLILAAAAIGSPLAFYMMNLWLENFAYRIQISWSLLLTGCLIPLLIAFVTLTAQSLKTAVSNPVEDLRNE